MSDIDFDALEAKFQASHKPAAAPDFDALEKTFQEQVKPAAEAHGQSDFDFAPDPAYHPLGEDEVSRRAQDLSAKIASETEAAQRAARMPAAGLAGVQRLVQGEGLPKAAETVERIQGGGAPQPGEQIGAAAGNFARDTALLAPAAGPLAKVAEMGGAAAIPAVRGAAAMMGAAPGALDAAAALPAAAHYAGAAAVGATISGVSSALEQMAKRGEVDPDDVRTAMFLGAPMGAAFQLGGDAATMALQARSSGALTRLREAVENRIDYELKAIEYRAQRGQGLDMPGEHSQYELVPFNVKQALAEGRITLPEALKMSSTMFEERLAAERASIKHSDPAAAAEALVPETEMLVKSGIPPEMAAKQVQGAAGALEAAARTAQPAPVPQDAPIAPEPAAEAPAAAPATTPPAEAPAPLAPTPSPASSEPVAPPPVEPAPAGPPAPAEPKLEKPVAKVDKPIKTLQNGISKKSRLPVLQNVHVKDGVATVTDLDVTAQIKLPDAPKDGLYKFVGSNLEPAGGDPADYPVTPQTPAAAGVVNRSEFLHELERTGTAASSDATRHVLNGVALEVTGDQATLVATDGRRLSLNKIGHEGIPDGRYIIPGPDKVLKLLRGVTGEKLSLAVDDPKAPSLMSFKGDNGSVTTRLIQGQFPQYQQVLPRPQAQIQVETEALRGALKDLAPYVKTIGRGAAVEIHAKPDSVTLTVQSQPPKSITLPATFRKANYPAVSEGSVVMPMRGHEATAALDPNFLADAVAGVRGKTTYLGLGDTHGPIHVYGKDISLETAPPVSGAQAVRAAVNPKPTRRRLPKSAPATDSPGTVPGPQQLQEQMRYDKVQPLDARAWQVELPREPRAGGPVPAQNINKLKILEFIEREFGVPIRGKTLARMGKATAGHYEVGPQLIRLKRWGELEVLFHEMFHHIDDTLKAQFGKRWKGEVVKELPANQRDGAFKELRALDYDQTQMRVHEGLAEYGRLLISLPDEAARRAPLWHEAFTKWQAKHAPDLAAKFTGVRQRYDLYRDLGSEGRILSQIDFKGELKRESAIGERFDKAVDWIKEKFFDEFAPIEKVQKDLGIENRRPTRNAFKMATYAKQKASGIARTFVEKAAVDEYGNVVGPSLKAVLFEKVKPQEMRSFIAYATAKRALLVSSRGMETGFDTGDAAYVVKKGDALHPDWAEIADNVTKWADHGLDWLVRAGGLGPNEAELVRELNPIYLPLKRVFIDEIDRAPGGAGGAKMTSPTNVHRLKGSARPIINPIEAMVGQMTNMIARAHKVRVASLIADWAKIKGAGRYIAQLPPPMVADTISIEAIKAKLIALGADLTNVDTDQILTVFHQAGVYRGKDNVVSIWKGGQRRYYELHPDLYRALQGVDDLRLDSSIMRFMGAFARLRRLGATGLNAGFGLIRSPIKRAMTYKVYSRRSSSTIFDPAIGAYRAINAPMDTPEGRFQAAGGAMSSPIGYDRASTMAVYDEMLTEQLPHGKVLKVIKHPLTALRGLLQLGDLGPRTAELTGRLKDLREQHPDWSDEDVFVEAFNDAQDVDVNFTRSGSYGKRISQVSAFFNDHMQGLSKTARMVKEDPFGVASRGVFYLSSIAIANWIANKDKQWWQNLDPAYKYNNLFFEAGGEVFRLPIPFQLGTIFIGTPLALLDQMQKEDPAQLKGLIANYGNFIPNPTPSMFQPAIDVMRNKDFLGRPIESEGMKYEPPSHRMNYHTSEIAKALAPAVEALGIPLSPAQLDYLIYNYTGGLPKQFNFFGAKEMADLPLIGDVLVRAPEKPARQINEMMLELKDLRERKTVKELQPGEPQRLAFLEDVYKSTYKPYQDRINKMQEGDDAAAVRAQYEKMSIAMAKRGLD